MKTNDAITTPLAKHHLIAFIIPASVPRANRILCRGEIIPMLPPAVKGMAGSAVSVVELPSLALGESDPLLAENSWYQELAADPAARQQRWREFLLGDDAREATVQRGDWVVGDDEFRQATRALRGRPAPRRRGRPSKPGDEIAGHLLRKTK
jgi:hypothetical protein